MSQYSTLRKWLPEDIATPEAVSIMVKSVLQELSGAEPGNFSVVVGGDTLILGIMDGEAVPVIYECQIRSSNVNPDEFPLEVEAIFAPKSERPS